MKKTARESRREKRGKIEQQVEQRGGQLDRLIIFSLLLATIIPYLQLLRYDFINYDDNTDVYLNDHVRAGLNWSNLKWAAVSVEHGYWFPVTRISHIFVSQFFGLDPAWHHFANVLIHAISAAFLFAIFQRMTGSRWPSAFVAFVFALHPLHVESVAWIVERKDVLCAFFWFLTMWFYIDYARSLSIGRYLLVMLAFALGAMSKPMIVTLPFALLLMDVWPLERTIIRTTLGLRRIILEKIPLLAISAAASAITIFTQNTEGAMQVINPTLWERIENALISYVAYLFQFLWPVKLAFIYSLAPGWPAWQIIGAAAILTAISIFCAITFRNHPYLAVGWAWYVGTLLPVIGLIQAGGQSRADRFTYLPLIGISIMLGWGAVDAIKTWPQTKSPIIGIAALACIAWTALTWKQIQYWKDTDTVFEHAVAVTERNYLAKYILGAIRLHDEPQKAVQLIESSLEDYPKNFNAQLTYGGYLARTGQLDDAILHLSAALKLKPHDALAHSDMGLALTAKGNFEAAANEYRLALQADPTLVEAHDGLAAALAFQKKYDEAKPHFLEAIRLNPNNPIAHGGLGKLLLDTDDVISAVNELTISVRLNPRLPDSQLWLGQALLKAGRLDEARSHFEEALRLDPDLREAREAIDSFDQKKN